MCISVPGLYPLDAISTLSIMAIKNISSHCQISPGRQNYLQLRTNVLDVCIYSYLYNQCTFLFVECESGYYTISQIMSFTSSLFCYNTNQKKLIPHKGHYLCGVCMFTPCLHGFSLGLWFPPPSQRHACEVNWHVCIVPVWVWVWVWVVLQWKGVLSTEDPSWHPELLR